MNKANQKVVIQNANITLIAIRQMEISYFSTFFSSFGLILSALASALAGSVSQTPAFGNPAAGVPNNIDNYDYGIASGCSWWFAFWYFINVATCIGTTCLLLIGALFIIVFGQGLAIRGPAGSMIATVTGMIKEQALIVKIFIFSIITFQFQVIGLCFIVMDYYGAAVCSLLVIAIGIYTYQCSIRIYNRFKWDFDKSGWNFDIQERHTEEEQEIAIMELSPELMDEILNSLTGNRAVNRAKIRQLYQETLRKGLLLENDSAAKKKNALLAAFAKPSSSSPNLEGINNKALMKEKEFAKYSPNNNANNISGGGGTIAIGNAGFYEDFTGGYLSVKIRNQSIFGSSTGKEKWIRYFFLVRGSFLYYYHDRNSCERFITQPINTRPIELEGYSLKFNSDLTTNSNPTTSFIFDLIPESSDDIRKSWKFRCDTLEEFNNWTNLLQEVIRATKK